MDVSMNTQAVEVEAGMGRPVMVGFHALFSFGGMIGALAGSAECGRGGAHRIFCDRAPSPAQALPYSRKQCDC
jgi:hypothetical protein